MSKPDGGLVFPAHADDVRNIGMTLRDYFAAKVLNGLIANNASDAPKIVSVAYKIANLMIAERDK